MTTTPQGYGFGWIPSNPNHPDSQRPLVMLPQLSSIPANVDLTPKMGPIDNQEDIGCCTAGSVASLVRHAHIIAGERDFSPSLLFNYAYSRKRFTQGPLTDSGSTISFALASAVTEGICSQELPEAPGRWVFDPTKVNEMPDNAAVYAAKHHRATWYWRVQSSVAAVLQVLAHGWPVAFGIDVFPSFYQAGSTGIIPRPSPGETPIGGHAMCFCGYDDAQGLLKVRNQWGTWGPNGGYLWLPFTYPFSDCWTIAKESA